MNNTRFIRLLFSLTSVWLPLVALAENPHWIWSDNHGVPIQTNEVRFFRKTFNVSTMPSKAMLSVAADDEAIVYLNGKGVARPKDYAKPVYEEVKVKKGQNVIAIRGLNIASDQAGVLLTLELKQNKQRSDFIVTDKSWLASRKEEKGWEKIDFDDRAWSKAISRGKLGD